MPSFQKIFWIKKESYPLQNIPLKYVNFICGLFRELKRQLQLLGAILIIMSHIIQDPPLDPPVHYCCDLATGGFREASALRHHDAERDQPLI